MKRKKNALENTRTLLAVVLIAFFCREIFTDTLIACAALVAGIMLFPFPRSTRGKLFRLILSVLISIYAVGIYSEVFPDPIIHPDIDESRIRIHFIDVGQGDSTFIEFNDGETMLIDGGTEEYGAVISKYIQSLGYTRIDYVVGTHPHADHIGGLVPVIQKYDIGGYYTPQIPDHVTPDTYTPVKLDQTLKNKKIQTTYIARDDVILENEDLSVKCISPKPDAYYEDMNQYSAMISIIFGRMRVIITGDAGKQAEYDLVGENLECEVLRLGHHGSGDATSYSFLDQTSPNIAVISVGIDNEFYDPNPTLLSRLEDKGIDVFRTDLDGTIQITLSKYDIIDVQKEK